MVRRRRLPPQRVRTEQRCRLLVFRSCPELEPRVFPLLADLYRKPVVPAGLLLPESNGGGGAARSDALRWLDEQPAGSFVYVALGTEAPVTAEGVRELTARALRGTLPLGSPAAEPPPPLLLDGFKARTRARGAVCTGWVPQGRVLAHAAVGAFLTHCGWGSVVESLRFGLPLVMLPFVVDQGLIARMMAKRDVGVEVARRGGDGDGWFGRDDVAAAVRLVRRGGGVEGSRVEREEAQGGRRRRRRRAAGAYVDELVDWLQRHCGND